GDYDGQGIAADGNFVYMVGVQNGIIENGVNGTSRLFIGRYFQQDLAGIPPTVAITAPATGSTVIAGSNISIFVNAVDDVAVSQLNFLLNGQVVFSGTAAPYQTTLTVPTGVTSITLGATARDLGGNVGIAQNVILNVIPDPGTTVVGRVIKGSIPV